MSCGCTVVVDFLQKIGCEHAAKMHRHRDAEWTVSDLRAHANEEERYLWPILRVAEQFGLVTSGTVDHLTREHEYMFGILDTMSDDEPIASNDRIMSVLGPHGRMEDDVVGALVRSNTLHVLAPIETGIVVRSRVLTRGRS